LQCFGWSLDTSSAARTLVKRREELLELRRSATVAGENESDMLAFV
jgi:hypothetical protein